VSDNIKWVHGTDFADAVGGDNGFTLIELPKGVSATRYAGWLDIKKRGRLSGIPSGRRELVSQGAAADQLAVTVSPGESQAYKSEHNMKGSRAQVFALLG
jgi:hypothetical protein